MNKEHGIGDSVQRDARQRSISDCTCKNNAADAVILYNARKISSRCSSSAMTDQENGLGPFLIDEIDDGCQIIEMLVATSEAITTEHSRRPV